MKLSKQEKQELRTERMRLSVDVGHFSYWDHMEMQKRLRRFKINCNTVVGGTRVRPKTERQLRKARRICKKMGARLNRGNTYRESF